MLKQITVETFPDIDGLFDTLVEKRKETEYALSESVKDDVKDWISKGDAEIFAMFRNDKAIGFVMNYPESKKIGIIHVDDTQSDADDIKRKLFDEAFDRLSEKTNVIRTGGPSIDSEFSEYIKTKGFKEYFRRSMMLERGDIKHLLKPQLTDEFKFTPYNPSMRKVVADLIYEANIGHYEAETFPDLFGSREAAYQFLESIEEIPFYPYSKVILHEDRPIGVCLIIFSSDDRGHIVEVCVHKDFRRRGLARNLLIYAFNNTLLEMGRMQSITLDVTYGNPARDLYLDLGFFDVDEFVIYTWAK